MAPRALRRSNEVASKHQTQANEPKHEPKKTKGPGSNKRKRNENNPGR